MGTQTISQLAHSVTLRAIDIERNKLRQKQNREGEISWFGFVSYIHINWDLVYPYMREFWDSVELSLCGRDGIEMAVCGMCELMNICFMLMHIIWKRNDFRMSESW